MKTLWVSVVVIASLLGLGCSRNGTCVRDKGTIGSTCVVNAPEDICGDGQFFKEASTEGVVRCKAAGFTVPSVGVGTNVSHDQRSAEEQLAKGEMVHYTKPVR